MFSWCKELEIYIYSLFLCSPTVVNSLLYASQQKRTSEEKCVMTLSMSYDIWSSGSMLILLQFHCLLLTLVSVNTCWVHKDEKK